MLYVWPSCNVEVFLIFLLLALVNNSLFHFYLFIYFFGGEVGGGLVVIHNLVIHLFEQNEIILLSLLYTATQSIMY